MLFDIGVGKQVIGVTKFCIFPDTARKQAQSIGGTKNLRLDHIAALQPDLIIGNKEENTRDEIEQLSGKFPVWMSDVRTVNQAVEMIAAVATICGKEPEGRSMAHSISSGFDALAKTTAPTLKVAYLIWNNPIMACGTDNFIHDVIHRAGWINIFGSRAETGQSRYPSLTIEEIQQAAPDVIFLSSEPYPFNDEHAVAFRKTFSRCRVERVDGTMFSWYGSRMLKMPSYLKQLHHRLSE